MGKKLFKLGLLGVIIIASIGYLLFYPSSFSEGIYIASIVAFVLTFIDIVVDWRVKEDRIINQQKFKEK